MPRRRPAWPALGLGLFVLIVDQASKVWAQRSLPSGGEVTVISGWVWFVLRSNTGATLGLLSGNNGLFIVVSLLVVGAVTMIVVRGSPAGTLAVAALGAIAGGGISNLVDRVRLGSVTDFIEVHLWPTDFNLADAAIRIGVVVFILALLLELVRGRRQDGSSHRAS
jgi:signal peptidase II